MKTAAQLLKLKVVQNRQVHSVAPEVMVLEALKIMEVRRWSRRTASTASSGAWRS